MSRAAHDNTHKGGRAQERVYAPFEKNLMEVHDNVCLLIKIKIWSASVTVLFCKTIIFTK